MSTHRLEYIFVLLTLCLTEFANGQPYGDANGDGVVDAADFSVLQGCLVGPEVVASPECSAFDIDANGTVDLADFAAVQHAVSGPANQCIPDLKYVGAKKTVDQLIGVSAKIENLPPRICTITTAVNAAIFVWTGVTDTSSVGEKWAQLGYARGQNFSLTPPFNVPGQTPDTPWYFRYAELCGTATPESNPALYQRVFRPAPPIGVTEYKCSLTGTSVGGWTFEYIDPQGITFGTSELPSTGTNRLNISRRIQQLDRSVWGYSEVPFDGFSLVLPPPSRGRTA